MIERNLTLLILTLVCNSFVFGQNWTGQVNSDWNNLNNWSFPPSGNSILIIDPIYYTGNANQPVVSSASNFIASELTIQNGADLTLLNALNISGNVTVKGSGTSLTVFQGGSLQVTANGNLNINLGAEFIQNDGFVSLNQKLVIANGQSNTPSSYILNSGNLVVNSSLSMESNTGNFSPVFNITAGTLTVNGEITWFGQAPGSGRPSFLVSGGTVNVNGNIKNLAGSTVDMRLQLKQLAVLHMNGSLLETIHATDSIITEKYSLFDFTQNCIIKNSGVYHAKSGTARFSGNTELQGSGTYQFHDVTILASGTVNHISPQTISVSGSLYTPGTFIHNLNTLVINGTSLQSWFGSSGVTLNNLTMNNIAPPNLFSGIWIDIPATITGHLELTQGYIATSFNINGSADFTLTDGATSSLGSVESFVDGPMRKIGNDAFIFPIGVEEHWGRLEISAPTSVTSEFTAYYVNGSFNNMTNFDAPISAVSNSEYWYLRRENTLDPVEVKLYWDDAAYSHLVDCNELSMAKWSGNSWVEQPSAVVGDCTGNGTGTITTDNLLNDFGYFTFAYLGNVTTENTTICDGSTLVIGTNTYNTSGIYTNVYPAFAGGDSTVITNLNVLPPNDNTYFAELCFGESINWFGQTFDEAGVYTESYLSYQGCDSTVHLVVSIADEINAAVTQNGGTFSAQNTTADSYEWINCQTNQPIQFATYPTFTPTENGTYAVRIRKNNIGNVNITYCEVQSECFTINTVGLEEPTEDLFSIYPNPNSGSFQINWSTETPVESIEIYDLKGASIFKQTEINGHELTIDLGKVDAGIYILTLKAGSFSTYKVVKK